MRFRLRALLTAVLLASPPLAAPALAATPDLVMLTPQESTMPMARFEQGALSGGMLKDVGDALAQRLGRCRSTSARRRWPRRANARAWPSCAMTMAF